MKKQLLVLITLIAYVPILNAMALAPKAVDAVSQNVTPLWRAVNNNGQNVTAENLNLIQNLINQGANPNIDLPGHIYSPLELAFVRLTQFNLSPAEVQRRLNVLRILLSMGARPINSRRLNLGILVKNMPNYHEKEEILGIVRESGLL
jgi:hypothetical protein